MSFVPPEPPFEPGEPTPPPSLLVPLPPPEVGFGSPWVPADAENRDRILDWWRMWWRRVFFPWVTAWTAYWVAQWDRLADYINTWISAADEYINEHAIAGYSMRSTPTAINPTGTTNVVITLGEDPDHRPLVAGDLVLDQTVDGRFGVITVVIDDTHATVQVLGSLKGYAGFGWWSTVSTIAHSGTSVVVLTVDPTRGPQLNDLVVDRTASAAYGIITAITSPTSVTVTYIGTLQGPSGGGGGGGLDSVVPGAGITVDATDPANPIVASVIPVPGNDLTFVNLDAHTYGLADNYAQETGVFEASDTDGRLTAFGVQTGSGVSYLGGPELQIADGVGISLTSGPDAGNPSFPTAGLINIDDTGVHITGMLYPASIDHTTLDPTTVAGAVIYDSGPDAVYYSNGTVWVELVSGGGGGGVASVVAGSHITVDSTDPAHPIVAAINFMPLPANGLVANVDSTTYGWFDTDNLGFQLIRPGTGTVYGVFQTTGGEFDISVGTSGPWGGFAAQANVKNDGLHVKLLFTTSTGASSKKGALIYDQGTDQLAYSDGSTWRLIATGGLESVVAGSGISIDDTDPLNPIISATGGGGGTVDSIVAGSGVEVDDTDPANPIVSVGGTGSGTYILSTPTAGGGLQIDNISNPPTLGIDSLPVSHSGGVSNVWSQGSLIDLTVDETSAFATRLRLNFNQIRIEAGTSAEVAAGTGAGLVIDPGSDGVADNGAVTMLGRIFLHPYVDGTFPTVGVSEGALIWNLTLKQVMYCDGSTWLAL